MKIRQTDFMQTGVAEVTLGDKEYLLPLFTEDIVGELNDFLIRYEEITSKEITYYRVCVRFFNPVREGGNFKLTKNSMEVLRTGVPGFTTVANEEAFSFLPYKFNCNLFPSYYN